MTRFSKPRLVASILFLTGAALASACSKSENDAVRDVDTSLIVNLDVDSSLTGFGCAQECALDILSPCTCGTDDPCGWRADGICDRKCLFNGIVDEMFDDAADCPGACEGACKAGFYTECSCGIDDPCEWSEDSDCDILCAEDDVVPTMFDDSADCEIARDAGAEP